MRHPPPNVYQHPPCVLFVLEAHHEVVGVPHDDNTASCGSLPFPLDPQVHDKVQKDIGQERADARPLGRPFYLLIPPSALQDTGERARRYRSRRKIVFIGEPRREAGYVVPKTN